MRCICGSPIEQPIKGRKRKYCSDGCRRAAEHTPRVTVKCAWRDCETAVTRGKPGKPRRYCSERCKRQAYYYAGIGRNVKSSTSLPDTRAE